MRIHELFENSEADILQSLKRALQAGKEGRYATFNLNANELDVRDWGSWHSDPTDPERMDDEDDDWQIPTDATQKALHAIVTSVEKKFGVKIDASSGEKNYYYFKVVSKTKK